MKTYKLGEICTIKAGKEFDKAKKNENYLCEKPGIIIPHALIPDKVFEYIAQVVTPPFWATRHVLYLTDFADGTDLHAMAAQLNKKLPGITQGSETPYITMRDLTELEIEI